MLRIAECFGLSTEVKGMFRGTKLFSKPQWKDLVWQRAWNLEDQDWEYRSSLFKSTVNLKKMMSSVCLLIWWQLSDDQPNLMYQCETMVKIVCGASSLKCDSYVFKKNSSSKYCDLCNNMAVENAEHMIMHCQYLHDIRMKMLDDISELELSTMFPILTNSGDMFSTLLGNLPTDIRPDIGFAFLRIVAINVYDMYKTVLMNREGVG